MYVPRLDHNKLTQDGDMLGFDGDSLYVSSNLRHSLKEL